MSTGKMAVKMEREFGEYRKCNSLVMCISDSLHSFTNLLAGLLILQIFLSVRHCVVWFMSLFLLHIALVCRYVLEYVNNSH